MHCFLLETADCPTALLRDYVCRDDDDFAEASAGAVASICDCSAEITASTGIGGVHLFLDGKEKTANLVARRGPVPARADNAIKKFGCLGLPEGGRGIAMQRLQLSGHLPNQEYLTVYRESTHFF